MPFLKKIFGNKVSTVSTSKINGVVPYGNENGTENSGSIAVRKPTISTRNRSPTSPPNTITRRKMTLKEIIKEQEKQGDKMDYEMMRRDGFKSVSTDVESASVVSTELGKKDKKFDGFGWITGVLIRCILCIFGATLFLRMSWIAGQSGILLGLCVIILSCVVVILTAISMSAIATNGEIKNGGLYYLVSRSLGPEYGGAIGLIFYVANTVNASMNCVGLAESLVDILKGYDFKLIDGGINDVRIYALIVCLILQLIIFIGTEFENKTQMLLLVSIIVSILSHFVGTLLPITPEKLNVGIVGYSWQVLLSNMLPDFRNGVTFITTFGVYFPAMTGIMGGANMSGDLKDPSTSIPKGTMWAIVVTTLVYSHCMLATAATTVRDATGFDPPVFDNATNMFIPPPCRANNTCQYGLANDYQVMKQQGVWPPLIILGIIATTLSSASGCLIGAPRVFQALCIDKLFPFIHFFAKGHGKNNDPFRAYFLTFTIAAAVICIGELNMIATLITNFFLAAFAITNFACFDATLAKSPGFRPGFRYYNKWLSLFGAILCIGIMFIISTIMSLFTLIIFAVLFLFIKYNKSHITWGSSTEANRYRKALTGLLKVTRQADHVKNYRPQVLVLTGNPAARQALVDFSNCITKGTNLLLCGHIIPYASSVAATSCIRKLSHRFTDWFHENKIKAFYCAVANSSLRSGVQTLLQTVGLGKMQPNIILIGYKRRWLEDIKNNFKDFEEYVGVINDAFEADTALCIFRNGNEGFDHSAFIASQTDHLFLTLPDLMLSDKNSMLADDLSRGVVPKIYRPKASSATQRISSHPNLTSLVKSNVLQIPKNGERKHSEEMRERHPSNNHAFKPNNKFRTRIKDGFVDVWWLFDDGGLTLLLAYLLTDTQSFLQDCKLRFFTICTRKNEELDVRNELEKSLKKFRIHYSEVNVIVDEEREFYQETMVEHEQLLNQINSDEKQVIPQELLTENEPKTRKFLRLREYLLEFSSASNFVILTLPIASSKIVSTPLYMMWLELLSMDMPPTLFVRGNQTSVLTYYS